MPTPLKIAPGLLPIVVFAALTPTLLMTAPAVAAQLASQLALTPAQIGRLFSTELGAMSLATLPAWYWLKRIDPRRAARLAALLFIAGNLASAIVDSYHALLALRFLTALAGGSLMILCMASAAGLPNPSRVYGLWLLGQLVLGAVGLAVLPGWFARYGLAACYLSLAALSLLALPLTHFFPAWLTAPQQQAMAPLHKGKALLGLAAILCFYLSLSGVWTFIGTIAQASGIDSSASGRILALATLMGMVGAALASSLGARLPRTALLVAGFVVMCGAILALYGQLPPARFAMAAMAFKIMWTFVLPLLLATLAELDPSGRLMNAINLMIGAGLAAGPAIAGQMLQATGNAGSSLLAGACMTLLALLLTLCSRVGGRTFF
ncbi:MFS transporter [Pseudomonas hunanensis]|uniref:MFS transporter n=1 Tax=Pseudomonas hunanensis TaxID=1247546 RepID=A0ABD6N9S4_9PSED|nr:MFS transporter [Pseudomonas hunanensis]NWL47467.1 MFS transporter [Pseudomonas hunanensis]